MNYFIQSTYNQICRRIWKKSNQIDKKKKIKNKKSVERKVLATAWKKQTFGVLLMF